MDSLLLFINELLGFLPEVAVSATLIAFLVDTAKRFGLPDGFAPLVSGVLNLIVFTALFLAGEQSGQIENVIKDIETIAPVIVALLGAVLSTPKIHNMLTNVGIGFSHPEKDTFRT